jgi:N-acetylneuraminic acid mutarotase
MTASSVASFSALTFNGTWRRMASLRPARWRHAGGVLGKSIVVVGGLSGDELHALSRVDAFNVETRIWSALADLPVPLYDANGATTINNRKLYVTGGRSGPNASPLRSLYVYDLATKSWSRKADMPLRGVIGVQANIQGKLYVYTHTLSPTDPHLFASYNPKTDKWVRLPSPHRGHFAYPVAGSINGKFYLTSGQGEPFADRTLEVYDPATRTWTTKRPMPTARAVASAAVVHGKLFVAGGVVDRNGLAVSTDVLEAYDPLKDTWATGPSLPTARGHAVAAWAGGKFFVIDGIADGSLSSRVEALSTTY